MDSAGQMIDYKGEKKYMKSPLEFIVESLHGELGEIYSLEGIIYDDVSSLNTDKEYLKEYGFSFSLDKKWFFPESLSLPNGKKVLDMMENIPSEYRLLSLNDLNRPKEKLKFENKILDKLKALKADVVLVDGLLVILDSLVGENSFYYRKIVNIHPGITREDSLYQRRGLHATMDTLYGAKGKKVLDWGTMETKDIEPVYKTGASLHFVDKGIDSGEVIHDVLNTVIDPTDTILELRYNNFRNSLFPALEEGLKKYAGEIHYLHSGEF